MCINSAEKIFFGLLFNFQSYLWVASIFGHIYVLVVYLCADPNGDLVRKFIMYILPKQKNCLLASKPQTYFWSLLLSLWKITCANMRADDKCSFCESEPETLPKFLLPLCVLPAFLETVRILLLFFNKGILSPYSARRIDRNNNL